FLVPLRVVRFAALPRAPLTRFAVLRDFFADFFFFGAALVVARLVVALRPFLPGDAVLPPAAFLPDPGRAAEAPSELQSTFFCDGRSGGSGMPANRQRSRYLTSLRS